MSAKMIEFGKKYKKFEIGVNLRNRKKYKKFEIRENF